MTVLSLTTLELTTLERLQARLGTDVPRALALPIIHGVSGSIQRYLNRSLEAKSFSESMLCAQGQQTFSLYHSPISSIDIIVNRSGGVDSTLDLTGWYWDDDLLCHDSGPVAKGLLIVSGAGGMAETFGTFENAYPDIAMAAELWATMLIRRAPQPDIQSATVSGTTTSFFPSSIPQSVRDTLDFHRRKAKVR